MTKIDIKTQGLSEKKQIKINIMNFRELKETVLLVAITII